MTSEKVTNLSHISNINSSGSQNKETGYINKSLSLEKVIFTYRLKYLCAQPCSVFVKSVLSRIPSGMQVYIILLIIWLEQLAYSASCDYLLFPFVSQIKQVGVDKLNLVRSVVLTYIASFPLFPMMGWIADVWVGQYRMIHFSLWLLWLGYAALALVYSCCPLVPHQTILKSLPIIFIIISVGRSGFLATAIPFGAEVVKYRTTQELSSYFHCFYWVRNLGYALFFITGNCKTLEQNTQRILYSVIAVFSISIALVLIGCFQKWFDAKRESINPYKKVIQVLYLAMVIKRPVHRSAFSFTGAKPPSRISLTKEVHGGKFSSEEVEDVKTFLRLLVILFCILLALMVYSGVTQAMPMQLHDMNLTALTNTRNVSLLGSCNFSDTYNISVSLTLVLLVIPILNFVLYPFLREYMPNMLKRIGMGVFAALLAQVSILALSGAGARRGSDVQQCIFFTNFSNTTLLKEYDYSPVSKSYTLFPLVLIVFTEILLNITSLEFFYAQSPHKMRGMMVGLFFFTWGLSSGFARLMMLMLGSGVMKNALQMPCDFWYHLFYLLVALIAFPCYVLMARRYQNRQRGENDSEVFYRRPSIYHQDVS